VTRRLEDKVAIVTGGGGGVGRAVAERFAAEGAALLIADIDEAAARETARVVEDAGGRALSRTTDVSNLESVNAMTQAAIGELGGLDILVNSAAIPQVVPILKMELDAWQKVIDINLTGSFLCAQAAARAMVAAATEGRIINISSITAQRAIVGRGAYSVAKGGLTMLTRLMAAELGEHKITVNAVAPGPVDTAIALAMHTKETREAFERNLAIKRYAKTEEVAAAAAFLASGEAGYTTGHTLNVDGGFEVTGMIFDLGDLG